MYTVVLQYMFNGVVIIALQVLSKAAIKDGIVLRRGGHVKHGAKKMAPKIGYHHRARRGDRGGAEKTHRVKKKMIIKYTNCTKAGYA